MFDFTGITNGKKIAVHPLAKPAIQNGTATDEKSEIDGNFYTAQDENTIWTMMPKIIEVLKKQKPIPFYIRNIVEANQLSIKTQIIAKIRFNLR